MRLSSLTVLLCLLTACSVLPERVAGAQMLASAPPPAPRVEAVVQPATIESTTSQDDPLSGSYVTAAPSGVLHKAPKHDDDPRPYDNSRNAQSDVDATLFAARKSKKNAMIVLGANWCHDSRALAGHFEKPRFKTLFRTEYELVYVDVGQKDRNVDIAQRFGLDSVEGTPTVFIISPKGQVLNLDSAPTWRNAASMEEDDIHRYFKAFADESRKVR